MGSTLLLVLAQLASPGPASPRELFEEGAALFEKGEFVRAAEKFEASFELRPLPVAKFNAARSWEKANKTLNAVGAWQAWLAASPATAPQRAEVETALAALGEKLAKQGVQAFTITSLPSGARVSLDGQARGRTPVTVELLPTRHLLRLDLEEREPLERTFDFTLEAPRQERFELVPLGQAPVAPRQLEARPLPPPTAPTAVDSAFAEHLGDDVVRVHLETDETAVRLYRAGGNVNGECRAPCDAPISRPSDTFWVGGSSVTPSAPFVLADHRHRGRASLKVKAGSAGVFFGLGISLLSAAIGGFATGVAFAASGNGGASAVGFGVMAAGGVGAIIAMVTGSTSVTFED